MEKKETVKFESGKKYTFYRMSWMAVTVKKEIMVKRFDEEGNPIFTERNRHKEFVLQLWSKDYETAPLLPFNGAVFEGWDQPVKCDSETSCFRGNACFNFIGTAQGIREWIDKGQLNPAFDKSKVLACGEGHDSKEELVYPELYQGGHAVIDRVLSKKEA